MVSQIQARMLSPFRQRMLRLTAFARLLCYRQKVSLADLSEMNFMSAALVKLQRKGQMVIPRSLREEAGVTEGTLMKVAVVKGGRFLLTPQLTIDRSVISDRRKGRKQAFRELSQVLA